jgi:hypothetical protein
MLESVILGCSFALLALFLPLAAAALDPANPVGLEIVSKRYSSGYLPVVEGYVEYEARLTNGGGAALENQSLRVSLVSDGNRTHSSAAYSVPLVGPGENKILHLGPFKMEEDGGHRLLAELDGAALGYKPDAFVVYRPEAVQAALVAIPLIAAGAGIVGFSMYRKRKAV